MKGSPAFHLDPALAALRGTYPDPEAVLAAVGAGPRECAAVSRLWMSEGIPFAFRTCPALYEEARSWLAEQLELDPKAISLRGSGRIGYSLDPDPKKWGAVYCPRRSDLDIFAVSERLFTRLREDFERWSDDYSSGAIVPGRKDERRYWPENHKRVPRNMERGFLDSQKVPNRPAYPVASRTNDCLARLWKKLRTTDAGPTPRKRLTLRCYRDWSAYERQAICNLQAAAGRNRSRAG